MKQLITPFECARGNKRNYRLRLLVQMLIAQGVPKQKCNSNTLQQKVIQQQQPNDNPML